jgi:hypothetical protein
MLYSSIVIIYTYAISTLLPYKLFGIDVSST